MKKINPPCVLTIAGTDPTGGAGIQADIKSMSATGSYAASVITALVAQNTQGVQSIHSIPCEFVSEQIKSVCTDLEIRSVKIGMLHTPQIMNEVAVSLEKFSLKFVVLDPVMIAKSGCPLLDLTATDFLKQRVFPLAYLVTPNLFETEKLLGEKITTIEDMMSAAKKIGSKYQTNILVKGGHLKGNECCDVLYMHLESKFHTFTAPRIMTQQTHGTGCTLSSAIASYLAQNYELIESISMAKNYLSEAILASGSLKVGQGCGPVDHFYRFRPGWPFE